MLTLTIAAALAAGPDAGSLPNPSLNRGQWADRVNIDLPPAPGGVVPEVGLVADPTVREGHLGSGWSLELAGAVSRHREDAVPALGWTSGDEYRIDGVPLEVDSGCYAPMWWDGSCFTHDAASNTWLKRQDGWRWTYGSADATWGPPGFSGLNETALWLLASVESPTGQRVEYEYSGGVVADRFDGAAQAIPRPERITYGAAEVSFEWSPRPDRRVDASLGALGVWEERLSAIEVTLNGAFYARYTLEYADEADYPTGLDCAGNAAFPDPTPTQTLVRRVVREAASGERFGAGHKVLRCATTNSEGESWESLGQTALDLTAQIPRPLDTASAAADLGANTNLWRRIDAANLNGDALPDLVVFGFLCRTFETIDSNNPDEENLGEVTSCEAEATAYLNTDAGLHSLIATPHEPSFVADPAWTAALNDLITRHGPTGFAYALADIDRDGFTDLLAGGTDCAGDCSLDLTRSNPSTGALSSTSVPGITGADLAVGQLADLDGDGFPDLILPAHDDPQAPANLVASTWIRNSGQEGSWFDAAPADLPLPLEESAPGWSAPEGWDTSLCADTLPTEGAQTWHNPDAFRQSQAMFADFNGDGLLDVAYALYACWEVFGSGIGLESLPETASAFSRIFYGDGRGNFYDSGLSAGEPWMVGAEAPEYPVEVQHLTASFASVLDVDRSGHLALLQYSGGEVMGGYDRGLDQGFFPEFSSEPDDFTTDLELLNGRYPWPRQAVFADFDGDGFTDQLRFEEALSDPTDYASQRTWSVTLHRAERETAQGRMVALTGPWGGTTELDWTFTAQWDDNPDLTINAEVIRREDGKSGSQTYRFSEGWHDGERFRGFGRAQVRNARGGLESYGFSVALPTMGAPIYAARYRDDETLAELVVNVHGEAGSSGWLIPLSTPYFAPLLRQCSFNVGPGAWVNGASVQSEDVDSLTQTCLNWNLTPAPSMEEFVASLGFEPRAPPGSTAAAVSDAVLGREPMPSYRYTGQGQRDNYGLESPFPATGAPQRGVATEHNFQLPEAPEAPTSEGSTTTEFSFEVSEWRYNADHSTASYTQHKDTRSTGDDLVTSYLWSTFDTTAWGWALSASTTRDASGAQLQAEQRSNFLAGYFDLPQTLSTCGRTSSACLTTLVDYGTTITGEPARITHPDNSTESWTREASCGLVTRHTDRVNRARTLSYDSLCRLTLERHEGGKVKTSYDALHRVSRVIRDPDEADSSDFRETIDVVRYDEPGETLREATLRDDGRLELRELDEWGRPTFLTVCEGEINTNNLAICIGAEQLVSATLWATDGSVYAEVDPHFDGLESPVFHLFTPDALSRTIAESHPGHDGDQALTTRELLPFEARETDPLGRVHIAVRDPLTTTLWTNGLFRGSTTRDALGQTTSTTDPDGRVMETEYDDHNRVRVERLTSDPTLAPGDRGCVSRNATAPQESPCTPEWTHSYDVVARTHTITDPQGIATVETSDAAGRLTRRTHDGAVVLRATWTNRSGTTPAKVVQIDESGARTITRFDGFGREIYHSSIVGIATTLHTADGWLETEDEDGRLLYAERDVFGRVRATCRASGWTGSACESPLWEGDYDGAGRVVWQADADGVETDLLYTPGGLPELVTRGPFVLLEREYDAAGRATRSFQNGVHHHVAYNDLDQPDSLILGDRTSPTVEYTYGWSDGGRLESVSASPVAGGTATTTTSYNDYGWPRQITHPDGSTEALFYDALGRQRFREDARGNLSLWRYDRRGRERERDLAGAPPQTTTWRANRSIAGITNLTEVTRTLPEGIAVVDYIDGAGRLVAQVQPDGTTILNRYSGNERWATEHLSSGGASMAMKVTLFDEESGLASTEWGWFGSPYAGSAPNRADFLIANPADYITTFEHTPAGRLRATTTGDERTEFSYEHGYLASETWDGVRERYFLREGEAPLVTATVEIGSDGISQRLTELFRDGAGRVTTTAITDPTGTLTLAREGPDALGNATTLRRLLDGAEESREERTFNARGWLTSRTTFANGAAISALSFGWDDDGVLNEISGLQSGTLSYTRSPWSQNDELVDAIQVNGLTVAEVTGRDGALRPTDLTLTGVYDLSIAYDAMSRITAQDAISQDPSLFPDISRTAAWDERGRPEQDSTSSAAGTAWNLYDYAEPGWLEETTSSENATETSRVYSYDAGGRRESSTLNGSLEHTLSWDGSALTGLDGAALTLDLFDAVIADDRGTTFTRDPSGALVGLSRETETAQITRDPSGWPILTRETGGTRTTTWSFSQDAPLEVIGGDGEVSLNLTLGGLRLGQLRDGVAVGLFEDARGTLLQIGSEVLPDPGPFGENAALPTSIDERNIYGGLEGIPGFDGLLLARHRELDTRTGTWLSPDPLGLAGGAHRQRYAEGDPLGFVDPLGLTAAPTLNTTAGGLPGPETTIMKPTILRVPKGTPDVCSQQPDLCNGKFAKSRKFILDGNAPPDTEVDASKSARRERQRASGLLDRLAARDGLLGRLARRLGGDNTRLTLRMAPNGDLHFMGSDTLEVRYGLWERWRDNGGLRGWWGRTFPEGWAAGWGRRIAGPLTAAWRAGQAWRHGRNATLANSLADNIGSSPEMLQTTGQPLAARTLRSLLQRTGAEARARELAVEEYQEGLAISEAWTDAGAEVTLAAVIVGSALMPLPGGRGAARAGAEAAETAARAESRIQQEAAEQLAKVLDEAVEVGPEAARAGRELPVQTHHLATNKNMRFTPDMEELVSRYGLDLDGDWNKVKVPHRGRHPDAYHKWVTQQMVAADRVAAGNTERFLAEFERLVTKEVTAHPEMLRKEYW